MPYHISKSQVCPDDKPYAVIKDFDGKIMGCHKTEAEAQAQIDAININERASWEAKMDRIMEEVTHDCGG